MAPCTLREELVSKHENLSLTQQIHQSPAMISFCSSGGSEAGDEDFCVAGASLSPSSVRHPVSKE